MKLLLLGKNGQVGWELQRALAPLGQLTSCGRKDVDFNNVEDLRRLIRHEAPDIVVNAAAYTAVDAAESNTDLATAINVRAVDVLAREVQRLGGWLVHYSTDYVFDGDKSGFYTETELTSPQNVYGRTKVLGEECILASGCRHLIFRTSWVYGTHGANFVKTVLRLASERDELRVVADQVGTPTAAELIADVTALCLYRLQIDPALAQTACGIYHLTAEGHTNWHNYAQFILQEAAVGMTLRVPAERVSPIATREYPLPAKRPANSRLDTQKIRATFDIVFPHWEHHVSRLVAELVDKK